MFYEFHAQLAAGLASGNVAVVAATREIIADEAHSVRRYIQRTRAWGGSTITLEAELTSLQALMA